MLSNQLALEAFFKKHQFVLEEHYPGINFRIILQVFLELHRVEAADYHLDCYQRFKTNVLNGVPLEYLTNSKYFYKSKFYIDTTVLIPRSETEILVEDALNFILKSKKTELRVAEVGVGSFAIGLSILVDSEKKLQFVGGDISTEAIEVAVINLNRLKNKLNQKHSIQLIESDRLSQFESNYDLIVSNPPYIKRSQSNSVHKQVLDYEPELALFLSDDEHDIWFSEFFESSYDKLNDNGAFLIEGHEDNLKELKVFAQKQFERVEIKKDYTGSIRFLHCFKEN